MTSARGAARLRHADRGTRLCVGIVLAVVLWLLGISGAAAAEPQIGRFLDKVEAGDLVPGRPWVHRSITMGYDRFPELLIDEKAALLHNLAGRNGRIFFTHDPACAMARITKDELDRIGSVNDKATLHNVLA